MEKPIRASLPNTFPLNKAKGARQGAAGIFAALALVSALLPGCVSHYTYPAAQVPESIERISKEEYKIDVTARVVGKTVGALLYVEELVDANGMIPKEVHEKMGKLLQVVSRVSLSTDLDVEFCSIVIRDKKSANELSITRSIDDTRRANAEALGVDESISRTLFDQGKYTTDAFGNSPFILKEVRLENFLADQIVQRIRYNFAREAVPADTKKKKGKEPAEDEGFNPAFILVDGVFENFQGKKNYRFSILSMKSEDPKETMLNVFKTVNEVLGGYKFTGFDQIEIQDYLNRQKLVLDRQTLINYQKNKIKDADIIARFLQESQSVQDAFKLFGFNGSNAETGQEAVPVSTSPAP